MLKIMTQKIRKDIFNILLMVRPLSSAAYGFFSIILSFVAHPDSAVSKLKNMVRPTNVPKLPGNVESVIDSDDIRKLLNLNTNCERPTNDIPDVSKDIQAFFEINVKLTIDEAVDLAVKTFAQNTGQWRKNREHRITASVCYSLFTYKLNKKADWPKKFDSIRANVSTAATIYGKKMEAVAFKLYKNAEPDVKKCGFVVNPNVCWLGASPEDIDLLKLIGFTNWIGRDKATGTYFLKQKTAYYGQIQLNLYLLNCDIADLVVYSKFTDRFEKLEIPYNQVFTSALVERLRFVYFALSFEI
jgi:YqaJ-like viral recombinase domain